MRDKTNLQRYCRSYSTCLGKFVPQQLNTLGFTEYQCPSNVLKEHLDDITVSPNGVAFVKPHIRQGVLRKMLTELLNTRIMVKESMKRNKHNKVCSGWPLLRAEGELSIDLVDPLPHLGCTAAWAEAHIQCDIWLHGCWV